MPRDNYGWLLGRILDGRCVPRNTIFAVIPNEL